MFAPLLTIGLSVALGTALGLLPGALPRVTGPLRTFAVVAATAVVGLHFLPHTLEAKGPWGLAVAAVSFLAITLLQRLTVGESSTVQKSEGKRKPIGPSGVGTSVSYAALLLHRVGDGAAMAASDHAGGVLLALGAHAIPVIALVTLGYCHRGLGVALQRTAMLGVVSAVSYLLVSALPSLAGDHFHGWLDAVASGVLVHIVIHELRGSVPENRADRALDIFAGAAGALLVLGPSLHDEKSELQIGQRLLDLALHTAPMLLVGLVGGALLQVLGPKMPKSWLSPRGALSDAVRGALYGAPLPLCSCSVLPISKSLRQGGAGPALVVSFLIATPELGLETLTLSARMLGWPFALLRLFGALAVAFVAGLTISALANPTPDGEPPTSQPLPNPTRPEHWTAPKVLFHSLSALEDLCLHIGGWIALGLLAAAYADALIPNGSLATDDSIWLQLLIVSAVAVPSYVCAPSATPMAAALLLKGLSPGSVLVGLLLGPATNLATLLFLRRSFGIRALLGMVGAMVISTWTLAIVANEWLPPIDARILQYAHSRNALSWVALLLLGALVAKNVWSVGLRGWLGASLTSRADGLRPSTLSGHRHAHGHKN